MMLTVLIISFIGISAVVGILFKEQIAGNVLAKKLSSKEEINQKLQTDIVRLKSENDQLNLRIQKLVKADEDLNQSLRRKEEAILKYQETGLNLIAQRIDQTKISEVMSSKVISIHADAPFSEVARKMQQNDIRHLPIVDDEFKLVGLMTQRMLYQIRSPRKLDSGEWYYDDEILNDVILKNVMEKEVVSLHQNQSIGKALMKMAYTKCGAIPIVQDENKLIGIVTRKDILKFAADIYQNKKI